MNNLSIWTELSIVGGAAVLGCAGAFLLALVIAVLLRLVAGANAPPPIVLVAAGYIGRLVRSKLWPAAAAPRPAGKRERGETVKPARPLATLP